MNPISAGVALLRAAVSAIRNMIIDIEDEKQVIREQMDEISTILANLDEDVFQGEAATKFRADVQQRLLPEIEAIETIVGDMCSSLDQATTIMEQADTRAAKDIDNLGEAFRSIY